jgi:hypothetical protein
MNPFNTISLILVLTLATGALLRPMALSAQEPPAIQAARALDAKGRYEQAADTLGTYLEGSPEDGGSWWYMGQLLHRAGALSQARDAYAMARARLPESPWLELEFGRLLLEMGEWTRASDVLEEVRAGPVPEAAAEANRTLSDLRTLTAPWVRFELATLDDNQPYRRHSASLEAGFFLNPLWSLTARGAPSRLDAALDQTGVQADLRLQGYVPALRLHLAAQGGGAWDLGDGRERGYGSVGGRADFVQGSTGDWTGALEAGVELGRGLALEVFGRRSRYLWTLASADTLVMENAVEVGLDRSDAPGWAGELQLRQERFADGNRVDRASGWILAPVVGGAGSVPSDGQDGGRGGASLRLRLGYAFSWADARESRWVAAPTLFWSDPGFPEILPLPGDELAGRYDPYHTPRNEQVHNLLGEVALPLNRVSLQLNGSYGVHAREDAPVLIVTESTPGSPSGPSTVLTDRYFYQRSFSPWRLTLAASASLSPSLILTARGQAWETAFYEVKELSLELYYRLGQGSRPEP